MKWSSWNQSSSEKKSKVHTPTIESPFLSRLSFPAGNRSLANKPFWFLAVCIILPLYIFLDTSYFSRKVMTFRSLFDKEKNGTNKNSTKMQKVKYIYIYIYTIIDNKMKYKKIWNKTSKNKLQTKKKPNRNTWFCPE